MLLTSLNTVLFVFINYFLLPNLCFAGFVCFLFLLHFHSKIKLHAAFLCSQFVFSQTIPSSMLYILFHLFFESNSVFFNKTPDFRAFKKYCSLEQTQEKTGKPHNCSYGSNSLNLIPVLQLNWLFFIFTAACGVKQLNQDNMFSKHSHLAK